VRHDSNGLDASLVIGSRINGLTCGGLRFQENLDEGELRDLAKVMELKQSLIGLPRGGSRAGIQAPVDLPDHEKQQLMNRFAELVAEELQDRKWLVAIDIGTNISLVQNMYRHIGVAIPKPSREIANAGYFTALGVLQSIQFCLAKRDLQMRDCTFAIEGMGNVGSSLFRLLVQRNATVTAISDVNGGIVNEKGLSLKEALSFSGMQPAGSISADTRVIEREALLESPVDVICPCATSSTINAGNVSRIKAQIVCAGANNPVTHSAARNLHDRDILYMPDFITNAGGALGNMVKFAGLSEKHLERLLDIELMEVLEDVYRQAEMKSLPPSWVAFERLNAKFAVMKSKAEANRQSNRAMEFALTVYRKGLVPKFLVRPLAINRIRRAIRMDAT
jgi:glutamate dehydrogenase/leucine dehydrogenase